MHTGLCYNVKWQNGGGSLQSALMTNTSHEISMSIDTTKKKKTDRCQSFLSATVPCTLGIIFEHVHCILPIIALNVTLTCLYLEFCK
jgi:hypothetical protein